MPSTCCAVSCGVPGCWRPATRVGRNPALRRSGPGPPRPSSPAAAAASQSANFTTFHDIFTTFHDIAPQISCPTFLEPTGHASVDGFTSTENRLHIGCFCVLMIPTLLTVSCVFILGFIAAAPPVDIDGIRERASGSLPYGNNLNKFGTS
jgi:hypothetical protein